MVKVRVSTMHKILTIGVITIIMLSTNIIKS